MNVQIPVKWLQELLALCGPEDHELRERVMVSITAMDEQTARAVAMPEPDEQVKELMVLIGKYGSAVEANSTGNPSNYTLASDESAAYEAIKAKLRALLATGGQVREELPQAEGADYFVILDPEDGTVEFAYSADLGRDFGHEHIKDAQEHDNESAHCWVVRPAYAAPQQADARDAELAKITQAYKELSGMFHDQIVAQQSAWIEWQHGKGAEAGMSWIENGLCGPGHIPDEEAPYGTDAQAWFDANKSNPFPVCPCGRPSNTVWMGYGFCSNEHYNKYRDEIAVQESQKGGAA